MCYVENILDKKFLNIFKSILMLECSLGRSQVSVQMYLVIFMLTVPSFVSFLD